MGASTSRHSASVQEFLSTGVSRVRSVLGEDTIRELKKGAVELIGRFTEHGRESEDFWTFQRKEDVTPVLYRIHNLEKQDWAQRKLLYSPELTELAAEFIGHPVEPTAFAIVLKEPERAVRVPWHRDRDDVPPHTVCNLSIYLDAADEDNGCLEGVPESHLLPDDADVDRVRQKGPVAHFPVEEGDVVVHDVRLVHASGANPTKTWRRTIIIEFADPAMSLASTE